MLEPPESVLHRFEDFLLDMYAGSLFRVHPDGQRSEIQIGSRAFQILSLLVDRRGQIVSRKAIMDTVWPDTAVEENNLTVQLSALRRLLDANRKQGSCVQTVPGRGYRFVPTVQQLPVSMSNVPEPAIAVTEQRLSGERRRPVTRGSRFPSVAVLPFTDLTAADGENYFGEGLVQDVIGALASLPDIAVISHNSMLRYREAPDLLVAAQELGVRYVVSGNLRRENKRLRISADLIDAETLTTIETYRDEVPETELFAQQDRLTDWVVRGIAPNVRSAELQRIRRKRPDSLDAYDFWLRGLDLLYRLDRDAFDMARKMFEEAIRSDPDYASPYAFIALWHSIRIGQGLSPDRDQDMADVDRFASAALLRDPNDVWALSLSGHLRALLFRDYDTAQDLFDRALRASPNSSFAWSRSSPTFSYLGDAREGRHRAEQALRLSPFDPQIFFTHCALGLAAYTEGNYDEAVLWARRSHAENNGYTANMRFLAASLAATGKIEEARRVGERMLRQEPGFSVSRFIETYAYRDERFRSQLARHLTMANLPP